MYTGDVYWSTHTEMRRSLDQFKASGRLRPYTPLAITLDKADKRMPLTAAEVRSANGLYSAEVQEVQKAAAEARAHEIVAEMREMSARMQSAGLPRELLTRRNRQTKMPTGDDSWGFANSGAVPAEPEPEQSAGTARRQSRARRIATPELFNRLSIESASASWANETTGSQDEKWMALGLGSQDRRQTDLVEAGCTRVLQILDPGAASPPASVLRTTLVAIADPLMLKVEQLLVNGNSEGAISTQQQLVLRLAQRHLCGRREGWLADGETDSIQLLQQQVAQAVRWQLNASTSEAVMKPSLRSKASQWLQQAADLTGERGLWDDDDARRELRAAIFEAFSRSAAAKGRPGAAQKWLRKTVHLIDGMSIDMGGRKAELGAAAHLNLCATLSAGAKHEEAVQHALSARDQLLFRLAISPELPDQLEAWVYSQMTVAIPGKLPDVKTSPVFSDTVERILKAVQLEDTEHAVTPGAGQRVGQLLAAAYHNCAVQLEALNKIPAAIASVTVALRLAQEIFRGDGKAEVAHRRQYQRTHRMMRRAVLEKPWIPPPAVERSEDAVEPTEQLPATVFAVQSEPIILQHRRRTAGSVSEGRRRGSSPKRKYAGKVALAPLNPGLIHKRQSFEIFKSHGTLRPYTPDAILLNKPLSTEPPTTPPRDMPADLSMPADYLSHVLGLGNDTGRPSTAVVLEEAKWQVLRESDKREELASEVRETMYRRSPSPVGRPTGLGASPMFPPPPATLVNPPWNRGPGNTNVSRAEFNASQRQHEQERLMLASHASSPSQAPSWLSQYPSSDLQLAVTSTGASGEMLTVSPEAKVASEFTSKLIDAAFTGTTGSPSQQSTLVAKNKHADAAGVIAHQDDAADDRGERLQRIFSRADRNNDGSLTRAEAILRLRQDSEFAELLNLPQKIGDSDRDAFESVFQAMDVDDSRAIDEKEFIAFFSKVAAARGEQGVLLALTVGSKDGLG